MHYLQYELAFIGATVFASAAAEIIGENCIVIEKGSQVAFDYSAAWKGDGNSYYYKFTEPETAAFREELISRNILASGCGEHLPALEAVLSNRLLNSGAGFLSMAHITEIEKSPEGYLLKIFTTSGFIKICAKQIINTAVDEKYINQNSHNIKKTINLNIVPVDNVNTDPIKGDNFLITKGRFSDEYILKLPVDNDISLSKAKKAAYEFWINRPSLLSNWKLAAVSSSFDISFIDSGSDFNIEPSPFRNYDNFLAAYDAGIILGKRLRGKTDVFV